MKKHITNVSPNKIWIELVLLFLIITLGINCISVELDSNDEEIEQLGLQLSEIYSNCKSEGIRDQQALEDALNSGGNEISKNCRTNIGNLDFELAVEAINLDLTLPYP